MFLQRSQVKDSKLTSFTYFRHLFIFSMSSFIGVAALLLSSLITKLMSGLQFKPHHLSNCSTVFAMLYWVKCLLSIFCPAFRLDHRRRRCLEFFQPPLFQKCLDILLGTPALYRLSCKLPLDSQAIVLPAALPNEVSTHSATPSARPSYPHRKLSPVCHQFVLT